MQTVEYILVRDVGLSLQEVRNMSRSDVFKWATLEMERKQYEQEVQETEAKRQERRQDTGK